MKDSTMIKGGVKNIQKQKKGRKMAFKMPASTALS